MKLWAPYFTTVIIVFIQVVQSKFNAITLHDDNEHIAQVAHEIIVNVISTFKSSQTINLMSAGSVESKNVSDFKDSLLRRFLANATIIFRQDVSEKACLLQKFRKYTNVFMIENLDDIALIRKVISSRYFKLNGLYLIVLLNGDSLMLSQIFATLWEI